MIIVILHLTHGRPGRASSREAGQFHPSLALSRRIDAARLGLHGETSRQSQKPRKPCSGQSRFLPAELLQDALRRLDSPLSLFAVRLGR
jgi:hypothetical protein